MERSHLFEPTEVDRYVSELKKENPECPDLDVFLKEFFGTQLTSENTYKMIQFLLHRNLARFEQRLLELLSQQREQDLKLVLASRASPMPKKRRSG